jgi:hypothetical protein
MLGPAIALAPNRPTIPEANRSYRAKTTTLFNTKSGRTRYKKAKGEQVVVKVAQQCVIWLLTGTNGALQSGC